MAVAPHRVAHDHGPWDRPVLSAALGAADALAESTPNRVWALSDDEVRRAMTALGDVHTCLAAVTVAVVAEAKRRGLGSGQGWGPVDWARAQAPLLPTRVLLDLDVVAGAADDPLMAQIIEAVLAGLDPVAAAAQVDPASTDGEPSAADDEGATGDAAGAPDEEAAATGEGAGALGDGETADDPPLGEVLPVGKAAQIIRFHRSVRGLADPVGLEEVTGTLQFHASGPGGISEKELAVAIRHAGTVLRPDRWVEHDAEVRRAHRSLVKGPGPVGLSRYTLLLDEEGAATLDAAVDALAKPQPDPVTGAPDPRTPAARRADALLDLVARAVGAPAGVPRQAKTTLVVSMGLDVLQGRCRGAGLTPAGQLLTAETVRRLACDAQLVPVVLGSRGEILDQGEAVRLFNRAQLRHLWLRDRHCTFPGCSKPAAWTDAHHLVHWADGGPSDVGNAALLCRAHHTVVHRERYAGHVADGPHGHHVQWDLTPGSYDQTLDRGTGSGTPGPEPPRP
jgi:hypothetical protein